MSRFFEARRKNLTISTDPTRLDVDAIADLLSRSYWANTRTRAQLERALENSLVFGLYDKTRQIGLARVVSDYAIFAYLCDVIIHENHRGQGLGKWLLESVQNHPDLNVRRWMLVTTDAHGLYEQFGWKLLEKTEKWMMKLND
ncbi:MAG: GNAT family N-acetyltransferase [Anaerolineales bacterium]